MLLKDEALAKSISRQDELLATKGGVRLPHGQKKKGQVVLQQIFARAKAETHLALDQRNTTLSRFNALANNVNKWEECRNCGDDFQVLDRAFGKLL